MDLSALDLIFIVALVAFLSGTVFAFLCCGRDNGLARQVVEFLRQRLLPITQANAFGNAGVVNPNNVNIDINVNNQAGDNDVQNEIVRQHNRNLEILANLCAAIEILSIIFMYSTMMALIFFTALSLTNGVGPEKETHELVVLGAALFCLFTILALLCKMCGCCAYCGQCCRDFCQIFCS